MMLTVSKQASQTEYNQGLEHWSTFPYKAMFPKVPPSLYCTQQRHLKLDYLKMEVNKNRTI